jgi:hypothetical protein
MSIQKRIITPELDALYHTTPMDTLSNDDLFQVLQFGARAFEAKAEVLSRLKTDPNFIYRMFEFGRNEVDPRGSKFSDWFNCTMPSAADFDARILNEIINHGDFSNDIKSFIPQVFSNNPFMPTLPAKDVFRVITAYMTWIEKPNLLFTNQQGLISPVLLAFRTLSSIPEKHEELARTIHSYMSKLSGNSGPNLLHQHPDRAKAYADQHISQFFKNAGHKDIRRLAAFTQSISCFDNAGYKYTVNPDDSDIQKLCSSKLVSEDVVIKLIDDLVKSDGFDRLSLINDINSRRTFDILSNFVTRDECFKLGARRVRGFMLEDELGL